MSAVVGADGLLERLRLSPRTTRLDGATLADQIVAVVRAAQQDRLNRVDDTGDEDAREGADNGSADFDVQELILRVEELEFRAYGDLSRLNAVLDETLQRLDDA